MARITRHISPLWLAVAMAAMFVIAGGFVHLREWLDTYRYVPEGIPGAAVVRLGFPLNAVISMLVGAALIVAASRRRRVMTAAALAILFQIGSLAAVIVSRTGSLFGWRESGWGGGAEEALAVQAAALVALLAVAVLARASDAARRSRRVPAPR